ncbi:hypothetical protein J132_08668 [Termitomyces sp. J132]|nr:hypothetical protein J132_08668 [Termitomyces sp. J132]
MFRVPFLDHWEVVVTEKKFINELAQAQDKDLSVIDAVADVLQTEFTMGHSIKYDQYHVGVIGSTMTRNLVARFDDVYDKISCACKDTIHYKDMRNYDWVSIPAFEATLNIVSRTGNRLFVGLPLSYEQYIKEKDGSLCLAQDYQVLNAMTVKNCYPLLLISELVNKLKVHTTSFCYSKPAVHH